MILIQVHLGKKHCVNGPKADETWANEGATGKEVKCPQELITIVPRSMPNSLWLVQPLFSYIQLVVYIYYLLDYLFKDPVK